MAATVSFAVMMGKFFALTAIFFVGVLCVDEVLCNFSKLNRNNLSYRTVIILFSFLYFFLNNKNNIEFALEFFTVSALVMNFFLIYYLFKIPQKNEFMRKISIEKPALISAIIAIPLLSFGIHLQREIWREILAMLLIITYGMDTGAWFIGKNFGKHKLWPEVSPKKTIEGLVGGIFISSFLGSFAWELFFKDIRWYHFFLFAACGAISQVGDLIQSKIKREFQIKDSSNLIPGHGGIYDRIDSLIFLSPFFAIVVKYLR